MPDTVVVGETLNFKHSSQASLEFPLYHFLFVQRGLERKRKFQVVANAQQCKGLEQLLRVTVVGPSDEEMIDFGTPKEVAKAIYQETVHLALKDPASGKPFEINQMINFIPVNQGDSTLLYAKRGDLPGLEMERLSGEVFRLSYGDQNFEIDFSVSKEQSPAYKLKEKKLTVSKEDYSLAVLGRSNGFDPNDPANGYLINAGGELVLWDCPAYMHQHLKKMGLKDTDIGALVLSHVHEDHIDTSESLRDPPFELYTTPEIYYSLLVKLSAVFGCSMDEARKYHNWHPIEIGKPVEICGAEFEFFHSVHAIPSLGARVTKEIGGRKGILHISGDHLSNEVLAQMKKDGGISKTRYEEVTNLLRGDETLVLIDAGGGAIHGDYREYLDAEGRIAFMHTGLIQEELPEGKFLVSSGQVIDVLG